QWLSQYEPDVMKENLILTLVIALYFLAFTWFFDMIETKKNQAKLIQQKERAELSLLQSQLNPHFLFNALNTSYSTAISEGSEKAANQILQLSELMRFALEKSKIDYIQMSDEIGFLEKYIELQKSRFHHLGTANVQIRINWDGIEVKISPMLIQPFLENAFKFTALNRPSEKPVLLVDLKVEEGKLVLNVDNSYIGQHVQENKGTGNGIHLVRQRLKSLYPQKHDLEIIDMGDVFKVFLKIDLIG
ncbi:MAG: hypothetical protein EA341_05895, partial [Mongoliibacter sp.]|uniref:sensor histidine kinase n=1 Tax=Mongoliibacter sp. TaxID=2022438 RepID=UPI0012F3F345